ncbi:hypothetical protein KO465_01420 [Candidatus Micrarchaeota archaeon]|jgi:hypothetical protein|nr:hypothetical protein [Candidatus Micrarchaeota archaeon]
MKIWVKITEKEQKTYKKIGADPTIVLWWVNKEIVKIIEETENIYGVLRNLDEETLVEGLIKAALKTKERRKEQQEINRHEAKERERRKKKMGKIRERHLENVSL